MQNAIANTISELQEKGGLRGVDVASIADVSKATVSRWNAGTHFPQPKTQLLLSDLRYIVMRLSDFYNSNQVRVWLNSRNELLKGERAIDLIHQSRTDEVIEAIESLSDLSYI